MIRICGIFGRVGRGPVEPFRKMALSSMRRGVDAGGIGWRDRNGTLRYQRRPGAIRKLLRCLPAGALNSDVVIGHTRMATTGSPDHNYNNHPFGGKRWVIVHNGWVHNWLEYPGYGDCDSEAILTILERHRKAAARTAIAKTAKKLSGCFACAAMDTRDPFHVYLWRDSNPIWYAQLENSFVFASEWSFIERSYKGATAKSLPMDTIVRVGRYGITHQWGLPSGPRRWRSYGYRDEWYGYGDYYSHLRSDEHLCEDGKVRIWNAKTQTWMNLEDYDRGEHPDHEGTKCTRAVQVVQRGQRHPTKRIVEPYVQAFYNSWTFEVFCPSCARLVEGDYAMQLDPIYGPKHWIFREVTSADCTLCGDPIFSKAEVEDAKTTDG